MRKPWRHGFWKPPQLMVLPVVLPTKTCGVFLIRQGRRRVGLEDPGFCKGVKFL